MNCGEIDDAEGKNFHFLLSFLLMLSSWNSQFRKDTEWKYSSCIKPLMHRLGFTPLAFGFTLPLKGNKIFLFLENILPLWPRSQSNLFQCACRTWCGCGMYILHGTFMKVEYNMKFPRKEKKYVFLSSAGHPCIEWGTCDGWNVY